MTREVLDCLQGEQSEEEPLRPGQAGPAPLAGEAEGTERETQTESNTTSAPAGQLPFQGKAEEPSRAESSQGAGRRESRGGAFVPDARMLREHLDRLQEQAAQIPGFDLMEALQDPAFVRLTAPGVGVSAADAWYALHREENERRQTEESRKLLARAAAASAGRPREGGGTGAALIASDYRSLSRAERLHIKQRILEAGARGEKIYP